MRKKVLRMVVFLLIWFGMAGCENDKEEYDKAPDWLKGNAYELLSSKGNYKLFLEAVEMTGYLDLLNGKGLCTVFAPDDNAMKAWLAEQGESSLSGADLVQLKLMVGYHIIEQAYTREMISRFTMYLSEPGKGEAYKFKTFAKEEPIEMFDEVSNQMVKVFQREKYLPIFSTVLYETRECSDPEMVHKYLFPDVSWKGMDDKLYLGNSSVMEYEIPTDNGYVYTIDKVVDLVPTLYEALGEDNDGTYTTFRDLFDRFKFISYDEEITNKYAVAGEKLYQFYHNDGKTEKVDLPELASEWAYHGQQDALRESLHLYMTDTYNCFAFTNSAFAELLKPGGYFSEYKNYTEIPQIALFYLLKSHADDHKPIKLIDDILDNGVAGELGEKWILEPENILSRRYCANGVLYGVDSIFRPMVFDIITDPLFRLPIYSVMSNMFHKINEFVTLVTQEADSYTLFLVPDEIFEDKNYRVNYMSSKFGDEEIQQRNANGTFNNIPVDSLIPLVRRNIIYGKIDDFKTPKYYASKLEFNYVFVENDRIYTETSDMSVRGEPYETKNGVAWEVDDLISLGRQNLVQILERSSYTKFRKKLIDAELFILDEDDKVEADFLAGDRYMVFVPSDSDLAKAPTDKDELANYLKSFFISTATNMLSNYILPKFQEDRQDPLETLAEGENRNYKKIYVKFSQTADMSLTLVNDGKDQAADTDGTRAIFATDGVIFKLKAWEAYVDPANAN